MRAPVQSQLDFTLEYDHGILNLDPSLLEKRCHVGPIRAIELAFDRRALGASTNDVGIRAVAKEKA